MVAQAWPSHFRNEAQERVWPWAPAADTEQAQHQASWRSPASEVDRMCPQGVFRRSAPPLCLSRRTSDPRQMPVTRFSLHPTPQVPVLRPDGPSAAPTAGSFQSFWSQIKCHLLREAFPDHPTSLAAHGPRIQQTCARKALSVCLPTSEQHPTSS